MTGIAIKWLRHFTSNPRDTITVESVETLAASLQAEGQLQELIVRKKSQKLWEVIVGNRRLSAFVLLAERGHVAMDFEARCQVVECDDETALRIALQENMQRADLDPMAEAQAFAVVVAAKGLEETAAFFGFKPAYVRQRLALASLSREVKKAYHGAKIGLAVAEALTTAAPDMQARILQMIERRQFQASGGSLAEAVRAFIARENFPVGNALFDVERSGLEVVSDLFGTVPAYFKDKAEAMRLQLIAVKAVHDGFLDKGYPAERIHHYEGGAPPLGEYGKPSAKDPKCVVLHVGFDGRLTIHDNLLDKAEVTRRAELERSLAATKRKQDKENATAKALSTGSLEDLSPENLKRHAADVSANAWRVALMDSPRIAKMMAIRLLQQQAPDPSLVRLSRHETVHASLRQFLTRADALYSDGYTVKAERTGDTDHSPPVEDVAELDQLTDFQLDQLLAFEVARTTDHGFSKSAYARLNPDIRANWTPDAWFLKRLPRVMLVKVANDIGLEPVPDAKKSFLVELLAARFARGEGPRWLPDLFVASQGGAVSEEGTEYDAGTGEVAEDRVAAE
jgi:ParB/RepB/Spo0J family partition protein